MDRLRELAAAATPGPWRWVVTGSEGGTLYSPDTRHRPLTGRIARFTGIRASADGSFAAAANPDTVLRLLDVVDAVRSWVRVPDLHHYEALRAALERLDR